MVKEKISCCSYVEFGSYNKHVGSELGQLTTSFSNPILSAGTSNITPAISELYVIVFVLDIHHFDPACLSLKYVILPG